MMMNLKDKRISRTAFFCQAFIRRLQISKA